MGDGPLLFQAVKGLWWLYCAISCAFVLPLRAFLVAVHAFVDADAFESSRAFHILFFLPRLLLSYTALALTLGYAAIAPIVAWLATGAAPEGAMSSLTITLLIVFCIFGATAFPLGMYYNDIFPNPFEDLSWDEMGKIAEAAAYATADLFAFGAFCGCVVTLTRLWVLFTKVRDGEEEMRSELFLQLFLSLCDWITLPFAAIVLLTVYRVHNWREECTDDPDYPFSLHLYVVGQALLVLFDLPFFLLGLCVLPCLWRSVYMVKALKKDAFPNGQADPDSLEARKIVLFHFFALILLDPLQLVAFLFVFVTHYRYRLMRDDIAEECQENREETPRYRFWNEVDGPGAVLRHGVNVLLDIPFFIMGACVCLFIYRAKFLKNALREDGVESANDRRRIVAQMFGLLLLDLIVLLPSLVIVGLTWYRWRMAVEDVKAEVDPNFPTYPEYGKVKTGSREQGSTPQWSWQMVMTSADLHEAFVIQAVLVLVDIPFFVCAVIVSVTWRRAAMRHEFHEYVPWYLRSEMEAQDLAEKQGASAEHGDMELVSLGQPQPQDPETGPGDAADDDDGGEGGDDGNDGAVPEAEPKEADPAAEPAKKEEEESDPVLERHRRVVALAAEYEGGVARMYLTIAARLRAIAAKHFLLLFADIVTIPAILLTMVLLWRAPDLVCDLRDARKFNELSDRIHVISWKHCVMSLCEIPFVLISYIITITGWRAYWYWRALGRAEDRRSKYVVALRHAAEWLADPPALVCSIFVFVTYMHANDLYKEVKRVLSPETDEVKEMEERLRPTRSIHRVVFTQFAWALVDLPLFALTMAMSIACPWRGWMIKRILDRVNEDESLNERGKRTAILRQVGTMAVDFPSVIAFVLVLFSWRVKVLYTRMKESDPYESWQRIILTQFWEYIWDWCHVIVAVCSLWRLAVIIYRFRECEDDSAVRKLTTRQFRKMIKDVPIIFMLIPMLLTVWRISTLRRRVFARKRRSVFADQKEVGPARVRGVEDGDEEMANLGDDDKSAGAVPDVGEDEDADAFDADGEFEEHLVIARVFLLWCQDLPAALAALLMIVGVWRLAFTLFIWPKVKTKEYATRRSVVAMNGLLVVPDIVAIVCFIPMLVLPWRMPLVKGELKKVSLTRLVSLDVHLIIVIQFAKWLTDVPVVAVAMIILAAPWRAYGMYRHVQQHPGMDFDATRRMAAFNLFVLIPLDYVCILCFAVVALCGVRTWTIRDHFRREKQRWDIQKTPYDVQEWDMRRFAVLRVLELPLDLIGAVAAAIVTITVWRYPTMRHLLASEPPRRRSLMALAAFGLLLADVFAVAGAAFTLITVFASGMLVRRVRALWRVRAGFAHLTTTVRITMEAMATQLVKYRTEEEELRIEIMREEFRLQSMRQERDRLEEAEESLEEAEVQRVSEDRPREESEPAEEGHKDDDKVLVDHDVVAAGTAAEEGDRASAEAPAPAPAGADGAWAMLHDGAEESAGLDDKPSGDDAAPAAQEAKKEEEEKEEEAAVAVPAGPTAEDVDAAYAELRRKNEALDKLSGRIETLSSRIESVQDYKPTLKEALAGEFEKGGYSTRPLGYVRRYKGDRWEEEGEVELDDEEDNANEDEANEGLDGWDVEEGGGGTDPGGDRMKAGLHEDTMQELDGDYHEGASLEIVGLSTLAFYFYVIGDSFRWALARVIHWALLPLKLLGLLVIPLHWHVNLRAGPAPRSTSEGHVDPDDAGMTHSFLLHGLRDTAALAAAKLNFWDMQVFALLTVFDFLRILMSDVGLICAGINSLFMLVGSLFVGVCCRRNARPVRGNSPLGERISLSLLFLWEGLFIPVAIALQVLLLLFPLVIERAMQGRFDYSWYASNGINATLWWNHYLWDFSRTSHGLLWTLQGLWLISFACGIQVSLKIREMKMPYFRPHALFVFVAMYVLEGVRTKRGSTKYKMALWHVINWSYNHRCLGELLVIVFGLLWAGWPGLGWYVLTMYVELGDWKLYGAIPIGLVCIYLLWIGFRVSRMSWSDYPERIEPDPLWEWDSERTPWEFACGDLMSSDTVVRVRPTGLLQ